MRSILIACLLAMSSTSGMASAQQFVNVKFSDPTIYGQVFSNSPSTPTVTYVIGHHPDAAIMVAGNPDEGNEEIDMIQSGSMNRCMHSNVSGVLEPHRADFERAEMMAAAYSHDQMMALSPAEAKAVETSRNLLRMTNVAASLPGYICFTPHSHITADYQPPQ
jgi:hypothetical protein